MKTSEDFMRNPELEGDSFFFEGNEIGIALFHGFTATTAEVRLLGDYLHKFGYTIAAPLLPGHGTHPEDLNHTKWQDWYKTAEAAYLQLQDRCEKVFVGGESMGALLALLLASRYPAVNGIFLASPALRIKGIQLSLLLQYFVKYKSKNQAEDNLPWKGYDVYSVKGLAQLYKLQRVVSNELSSVTQPLLVFVGGKDQTVLPQIGQEIIEKVKSQDKRIVLMPESPHVMLLAEERESMFQQIQEFIQAKI